MIMRNVASVPRSFILRTYDMKVLSGFYLFIRDLHMIGKS